MALVNMKASALLVGEERFNPKSSSVILAGFIGVRAVGDEKNGFWIGRTPPTNHIQLHG
jgi:hypothetical protein